jgi:hypothetical protein
VRPQWIQQEKEHFTVLVVKPANIPCGRWTGQPHVDVFHQFIRIGLPLNGIAEWPVNQQWETTVIVFDAEVVIDNQSANTRGDVFNGEVRKDP